MASSLMLTATTTYAQSVKAYKNGNATDYSFSSLNYGTLNNVDSIVVSGTLNSSNITLLHNALGENANYSLLKADFSNAVFSTNKLDSLFNCFFGLESVIFPNATNNNSISMESMFYKCSALKSIVNLDKLTNITSLFATFYMCENLTSIKFSSTTNNNAVSFSGCFVTCSSLTEIENLEKFTNITDITTAFYGCSKLGIIRLSNIPEQYTMAFSSCNAYIFLPDGMTDYPNNITWTNVVLEMTSVSMSKKATFTEDSTITLPTFSIEPESMKKFIKGTKYQLSNDGFATFEEYTPNTNVTKDYSGYKLRVGVTNPRMTGYIYSEPVDVEKLPFKVTAYFGKTAKKYATEQLDYGTLASADSIIAYGTWVSRDASQLRRAIVKSSDDMTNDKTKKVDMSEVEISESSSFTGFQKLFMNATALETIILPNTPNESYNIISMCNNCTNLKTILNFEKLTSVTFAEKAFYNCSKLKEIHLGSKSNLAYNGTDIFTGCNALKYMPDGVTTLGSNLQNYNNFVLPFTSASLSGTASFNIGDVFVLPTINPTPAYCAATDIVYELSNDDFATKETYTPNTIVTKDYTGYKMRIGAKNASMNDYVYSTDILDVTKVNYVLTAYTNGVANKYSIEQLATGTLATADSVVLYGVWTDAQIETFRKSLKSDGNNLTTNSALKKADLSDVTLSGDITSGMEYLFRSCQNLVSVALPSSETAGKVSLYSAFNNCTTLESIASLDKLSNITCLYYAFYNCSNLESLTFASTENSNSVNMFDAFYNCSLLESIANLEKLTNVVNLRYTFSNCGKLKEIHIGSNPNSLSGTSTQYAFDNCDALVYLPESVTTVPDNWKNYKNFVLPFTAIEPSGIATIDSKSGTISLPTVTYTPSYCVGTDFVYQISNNNFSTYTTHSATDVLTGNYVGYQVRVGAKNERMNNYVYSTNSVLVVKAPLAKAYVNGVSTEYGVSDLATGTLATADSVILEGSWNDDNIQKFAKSLKTSWYTPLTSSFDGNSATNSYLKKVDMSELTHTDTIFYGSLCIFHNCKELETVILPKQQLAKWGFGLFGAFNGCTKLKNVVNLDKIKTYSIQGAFIGCTSLESVTFCEDPITDGKYKLTRIFEGCTSLKEVNNFESFVNCTDFSSTFYGCNNLKEIHLGFDPNKISSISSAFYNCNAIKYLPDTVATIPSAWQGYTNFVLPITSVTTTGTAGITKEGGVMSTPSIAASPAYCAITDTIYQLSNNNFSTYTSFKKGEILKGNYVGYMLRAGVKNQRMANYVYSSASIKVEEIILLIAYRGDTATEYTFNAIQPGVLSDAEKIELAGMWADTDLLNLQKALKKNWTAQNDEENTTLINADLQKASFYGNISNTSRLFKNCTALVEVQLPSTNTANSISLSSTFSGCSLLKYIINLEKLDNIVKIDSAFYNCKTISRLKFSTTAMTAKIDFAAAFYGCSSLSAVTNLESFQNICGLTYAFANCKSLFSSLYFSQITNKNSIDATGAFDGSYVSSIYYFNYFENITNLSYTFRNCNNLGSITLGVDPNKLAEANIVGTFDGCSSVNKYLPDGVDTIPTIWQKANYNNFAVPIKSIDADIVAYITEDGEAKVNLQSCTTNPSYALCDWTNWKFSNDNFATTSSSLSNMTAGFKAVYGVKNNSMSDYIYSDTATATTLSTNIIVYRGKSKSTYTASTLENGLLSDADSIVLEGSWYDDNLGKLQKALKTDGSIYSYNHVLKSVNMANATFIGEISNGMKSMFYKCDSLKNVILPSSTFAGKISLYETFYYCYKLTSIENLDKLQNISNLYSTFERCNELDNVKFSDKANKNSVSVSYAFELCYKLDTIDLSAFTNITDLDYAFYDCINLKSLTFASANNVNHVGFHFIFSGCSKLSTIKNLDKFTNLYDFRRSFNNCNSLAKIELGTDPNSKSANQFSSNSWTSSESAYDNTFDNCNAIKYLPAKVTTIPENWKSYNNFVMPIDSVAITGKGMIMNSNDAIMPAFTTYPSYVVVTDTIWQLSSDGFKTVIDYNANTQVDFSMYALRCGVKNQSMSDYVYSKNDVQFEKIECYVKAYIAGGVKTYVPNDLAVGTLATADSVFLFGKWNDNYIQNFAKSLKTSWHTPSTSSFDGNSATNSYLKKVDMSELTHTDTIFYGSLCIFHNCKELETVILPKQQLAKWGFGLFGAFNGCTKLKNVVNLDKIKTYSIQGAFIGCTSLESVTFCEDPITDGKYKLTRIFEGCTSLKEVNNFESFVNCTDFSSTFYGCNNLKEIHLGFDPNESYENNINMSYTFYDCNAIKYLPDGVNDIPETWKYYNNFVIPFSLSANAPEYANNQLSLTCPSQTPSYAAMTDVVWRISNDKFATYDTYSMTNTLSPEIAAENPDYEIYDNPLNGDFTGYMLMCIAYNPKYNTRYYYEITDNGTVQFIADIDESEMEEFTIYPNPAINSFQINVGSQDAEMCIFNAIGNMVVKQQVFETATIDISNLPQGIYYVKVGNQVTRLTKM